MTNWASIDTCPNCNAGNPSDAICCIKCGGNLATLRETLKSDRLRNVELAMAKDRAKAALLAKKYFKPISAMHVDDFGEYKIWEYDLRCSKGSDETWLRPIKKYPAKTMVNRIIGIPVILNNNKEVYGIISNIDTHDPICTQHLLQLSLFIGNDLFHLCRYWEEGLLGREGPKALSNKLHLHVDEVFPISYDLSQYVTGDELSIKNVIESAPQRRLSREDVFRIFINP